MEISGACCWLVANVATLIKSMQKLKVGLEEGQSPSFRDLLVSVCDLALPLGLLGAIQNEGIVGLCGTISSLLGMHKMLEEK